MKIYIFEVGFYREIEKIFINKELAEKYREELFRHHEYLHHERDEYIISEYEVVDEYKKYNPCEEE